jgi:peptide/nickel transport system ATP-binding protein
VTIAFPVPRAPLVEVDRLSVAFGDAAPVVSDVSFTIAPGECLALVGESGSGKSVTARSLIGLAGHGARTAATRLAFAGDDLLGYSERDWRALRGRRVGFVLQDALGSLDPLRTVGAEIEEPLRAAGGLTRAERRERAVELLRAVHVPEPELRARQHPRQLSGGLRQRALIAAAIANDPALLIADEPTTALDAAVQAQILELLRDLRSRDGALIVVSHDLAVVAQLADRIAVMRHGRIVEQGSAAAILGEPRHEYTRALVEAAAAIHGARPRVAATPAAVVPLTPAAPLLAAEGVSKTYPGADRRPRTVVSEVSLALYEGETIGLVGASGSGKTTLTRMLLGLEAPDAGHVRWSGDDWRDVPARERCARRRNVQVIFQDPLASFDPRYTVRRVLDEPLALRGVARGERQDRAAALLRLVRLDAGLLSRRPIELSGGQRQRVAIARALALEPRALICDEPVSALDVSVQAEVLALLDDLKARLGLACLFISHDLGVVRRVSDRIAVMHEGRLVEDGPADRLFAAPAHPYTRALLAAIPSLDPMRSAHA